jgi:biopolymer transport protein ExbD
MRLVKSGAGSEGFEINMTPMIDVIFQLVLFFVFSMKFMAFEGQINSFLPKNRGLDAAVPSMDLELRQVTLFLEWNPSDGGAVALRTMNYQPPGGGSPIQNYLFPMDRGVKGPFRAGDGSLRRVTETKMVRPDGRLGGDVTYDYAAPDFKELETYLAAQKQDYEMKSGKGTGLRLTVNFQAQVPWQMVVNIVDICTRVGITDFALTPLEVDY